jgi:hypothetical protein
MVQTITIEPSRVRKKPSKRKKATPMIQDGIAGNFRTP